MKTFNIFLVLTCLLSVSCKKENIETDSCVASPTDCGCPQEPPTCSGLSGTLSGKVYVSPNGSDSNDGSEAKPFRTIQKAANEADPTKAIEIILRGGNYESKEIRLRTSNIYLHAYPGEWPIITAATNIEDIASCLWFSEPGTSHIKLENLEIIGGYYYGVKFESDWDHDRTVPFNQKKGINNVQILNCKIHDTGRDCIKITPGGKDYLIQNCEIYRSGVGIANKEAQNAEGIDNVNTDKMVVRYCYFHDIATNGLYAKGGAKDCVFEQNLLVNMGEGGLIAGYLDTDTEWFNTTTNPNYYESIDIIIRNNIVVNCKREGIGLYAALGAQVYNNTIINAGQDDGSAALMIARGEIFGTKSGDVYPKCKNLKIANNIIVQQTNAKGQMARLRTKPEGSNEIEHNYYYNASGLLNFRIDVADGDYRELVGITNWQTQTGFDTTSTTADPKLNSHHHLTAASPCIGTGKSLGNLLLTDYDGSPRLGNTDIGADQYNTNPTLTIPPPNLALGTKGTGGG
jgi:hypothetical protein